jgi:hypothetical protein
MAVFFTVFFSLISASGLLSLIILTLAGVDHGTSSFCLMLIAPALTIIHHVAIVFIPTYTVEDLSSPKGPGAMPIHTTKLYMAILCFLSVFWTISTVIAFYATGMNIASKKPGTNPHTGGAECAFGLFETTVAWAMLILCIRERMILGYKGVPLEEASVRSEGICIYSYMLINFLKFFFVCRQQRLGIFRWLDSVLLPQPSPSFVSPNDVKRFHFIR